MQAIPPAYGEVIGRRRESSGDGMAPMSALRPLRYLVRPQTGARTRPRLDAQIVCRVTIEERDAIIAAAAAANRTISDYARGLLVTAPRSIEDRLAALEDAVFSADRQVRGTSA
jgi:hypothetical protein